MSREFEEHTAHKLGFPSAQSKDYCSVHSDFLPLASSILIVNPVDSCS